MRAIVVLLALVLGHASARADEPPPATRVESYRTTAAIIDGIGLAIAVPGLVGVIEAEGGMRTLSIIALSVGVVTWVSGTPNLHRIKHGHKEDSYLSILIRFLVPGLAIGVSAKQASERCPENESCRALELAFLVSATSSMLLASALDIAFLAEREVVITPTDGGAAVGLAMRF